MIACTLVCLGVAVCSLIPGQSAPWGQANFTVIYMFVFEAGIGPVAYALNAELGSAKLRNKTVAWGMAVNNFWIGVTTTILPYLVNPDEANLKGKVGWIFFGSGVLSIIWSYSFIPETAGGNVDELDQLFAWRIPPRRFHKTVLDLDRSATYNA
jgi:SP family general alpha glucoside:H+ symporter-like MFS transporter